MVLPGTRTVLGLSWPAEVTPAEKRSLVAGGLGWMLDAMDVMLYSLVLAHLMRDLGMDKRTGGLLNSLTLVASAIGGLALRLPGRPRRPHARARCSRSSSTRWRAAPAGCRTTIVAARDLPVHARARAWAASGRPAPRSSPRPGRAEHRGKALGLMQSTWAIGEIVAAGGGRPGAAALRLARGLLRRDPAGAARVLDPPGRAGVGDLARSATAARSGSLRVLLRPGILRGTACSPPP